MQGTIFMLTTLQFIALHCQWYKHLSFCKQHLIQTRMWELTLVLNANKTKFMLFTNGRASPANLAIIWISKEAEVELVQSYKFLDILIDHCLSFKAHIENLASKVKVKLGFFFRNKSCFFFK